MRSAAQPTSKGSMFPELVDQVIPFVSRREDLLVIFPVPACEGSELPAPKVDEGLAELIPLCQVNYSLLRVTVESENQGKGTPLY